MLDRRLVQHVGFCFTEKCLIFNIVQHLLPGETMLLPSMKPLITEEEIAKRVNALGAEIANSFCKTGPITVIGLLRGAFVFMADLIRAISRAGGRVAELDFLIVSSYGSSTKTTGNIRIKQDVRFDIAHKNVLIVDDILDTGMTLQRVSGLMQDRKPTALKTVVLLDKPSRREVNQEADYVGFKIENKFVVGYGLDYNHEYRDLPYVTVVEDDGK
jgi:hypoxanthine phosphoribosyltransferase